MSDLPKTTKIHDLPKVSEVNDSDIFIIQSDENTNKIDGADLKSVMQQQALEATFVHTSDNEIHVTEAEKELWNGMSGGGSDYFATQEQVDCIVSTLTTNLLIPPTYSSKTDDGVTCTYNTDGSLTFNGETPANYSGDFVCFAKNSVTFKKGKYKVMLNASVESDLRFVIGGEDNTSGLVRTEISDSAIIELPETGTIGVCGFSVPINTVIDNITVKPIITTNLNATIDDFVPYTGNTGTLNGDVAEIRKDYLPLSGGTVGVNTWSGFTIKRINADATNTTTYPAVMFADKDGFRGGIGYEGGKPIAINTQGNKLGELLHTSNSNPTNVVDTEPTEGATSPYAENTVTFAKG